MPLRASIAHAFSPIPGRVQTFFVYMLRCSDGAYYVGHTNDLEKRLAEHDQGAYDGYTARRRPVQLVFASESCTREEAQANERRLKGWSRAKKEALIRRDWERISILAQRYSRLVRRE